jgi:hypothetical protein
MGLFKEVRLIADMQHALANLADREIDDAEKRSAAYSARAGIAFESFAAAEQSMLDHCALRSEKLRRDVVAAGGSRRRF